MRAKKPSICPECGKSIEEGTVIYYFPNTKKAYCEECGIELTE